MIDRLTWREADLAPKSPAAGDSPSLPGRIWMVTFADLVTLLLAVFVILFAMSGVRPERWQAAVQSLTTTLLPSPAGEEPETTTRRPNPGEQPVAAADLSYLAAVLAESLRRDPLLVAIPVDHRTDGLLLPLPANILDTNGAVLAADAGPVLSALAALLGGIGNQVGVRVPADRFAAAGSGHSSDWQSALAQAAAIANGLRDAGYARAIPVYAVSTGAVRAAPAAPDRRPAATAIHPEIVVFPHGGVP
jgi:chemotaxis protein MotB